jgi:hypothetical protein
VAEIAAFDLVAGAIEASLVDASPPPRVLLDTIPGSGFCKVLGEQLVAATLPQFPEADPKYEVLSVPPREPVSGHLATQHAFPVAAAQDERRPRPHTEVGMAEQHGLYIQLEDSEGRPDTREIDVYARSMSVDFEMVCKNGSLKRMHSRLPLLNKAWRVHGLVTG